MTFTSRGFSAGPVSPAPLHVPLRVQVPLAQPPSSRAGTGAASCSASSGHTAALWELGRLALAAAGGSTRRAAQDSPWSLTPSLGLLLP